MIRLVLGLWVRVKVMVRCRVMTRVRVSVMDWVRVMVSVRDSVCSGFSQYSSFIHTHIQPWAVSAQGTLYIHRVTLTEH